MIWGIIFFFAALVFDLVRDYKKWLRHEPINHAFKRILRPIILAPSLAVLVSVLGWKWPYWLVLAIPIVALMEFFWYWLLFDGLYNILRGFNWWFTGSDDPDDPKSDNFLQGMKLWQHIVLKVGFVIAFTLIYILCVTR